MALRGRDRAAHRALTAPTLGLPRRARSGAERLARAAAATAATSWRTSCSRSRFPAEFHAQTAVECALQLHPQVQGPPGRDRAHRAAHAGVRRSASSTRPGRSTTPPTATTASSTWSRCPLIYGDLTAEHYEERLRRRPAHRRAARQDAGRRGPAVLDATTSTPTSARSPTPCRCSSATARSTGRVEVEYPLGHRRRRAEGIPLLEQKFLKALRSRYPESQAERISTLCLDAERLQSTSVNAFSDLFVV